jgi:hypothetical protein
VVSPSHLPDPKEFPDWLKVLNESVKASEEQELTYYCCILVEIKKVLYKKRVPLSKLPENYVSMVLIPVITTLIEKLDDYKGSDISVEAVGKNLRRAEIWLNTALGLYDKKEEADSAKRIKGRTKALSKTRDEISKALKQWYHIERELKNQ